MIEPEVVIELLLPTKAVEANPNEETSEIFKKVTLQPGRYYLVDEGAYGEVLKPEGSKSDINYWVNKWELSKNSLKFIKGG